MTTTPNMGLVLADVGSTPGPQWASLLNAALEALDEHTHVSGDGVLIPSAALNINANLDIDDYSLTGVGSADLTDQASALTTGDRRVFSYSGELYYRDDAGNNVRITSGGVVDGSGSGSISGLAAYDAGVRNPSAEFSTTNYQFSWFYDTGLQARMQMGDIQLFPFDGLFGSYTNFWTIKSPTTLASNLTLTLPLALGATTLPLVGSSAGVLSFATGLQLGAGAASGVTYGFSDDTGNNTGMYRVAENSLGFASDGTLRLTLNTTALTCTLPFYAPAGTASAPGLSFAGDPNTGVYNISADRLGFTAGGVVRVAVDTAGMSLAGNYPLILDNNAGAATPALTFAGDVNTGLYWIGADQIGVSTGGTLRTTINSTGISTTGGLQTEGNGYFKVLYYVGQTLAAGDNFTYTAPGTVIGAIGYSRINNQATDYVVMERSDNVPGTSKPCAFDASGDAITEVTVVNLDSNSTNTFNLTIFYV